MTEINSYRRQSLRHEDGSSLSVDQQLCWTHESRTFCWISFFCRPWLHASHRHPSSFTLLRIEQGKYNMPIAHSSDSICQT